MQPHIDKQNAPTEAHRPTFQPMPCAMVATKAQQQLARIVARMRTQAHDGNRKPEADLGAIGNDEADFWGVLAEIVVMDRLEREGQTPKDYTFYADRSPIGPDFVLYGIRWNIKAVPPGKRYLSVNERQRLDPRHECDCLLPIRFSSADMCWVHVPVPYTQVAEWPLRQGHSAYRSIDVFELPVQIGVRGFAFPIWRKG